MTTNEKLDKLRQLMLHHKLEAYLVTNTDAHLNEYLPDNEKAIQWLTGFTGSTATVVVTHRFAGLWTDSRYFLQAEAELSGSNFTLVPLSIPHTPEYIDYLKQNLAPGSRLGICDTHISYSLARQLNVNLAINDTELCSLPHLVFQLWADRTLPSLAACREMPVAISGEAREVKIAKLRQKLAETGCTHLVVSALDDIGWLLNVRGNDIPYNPLVTAHLILSATACRLFIDPRKVDAAVRKDLEAKGVELFDYGLFYNHLHEIPDESKVYIDDTRSNYAVARSFNPKIKIIKGMGLCAQYKCLKNSSEIEGIRSAMVQDGLALTRFYIWLEGELQQQKHITEYDAACHLTQLRQVCPDCIGDSFAPIVGSGKNGAVVHYTATQSESATLSASAMLLIDSGGQYHYGTTDITRTTIVDSPDNQQKRDYTLVLRGHLAIAMARFPVGTKGYNLDTLARIHLWNSGLNYGHGTGHGVGHALNVHESPPSLSQTASTGSSVPLAAGMVLSDEPGLYRSGQYGIRIENMILAKEGGETEFGRFLSFEMLTLFPYCIKLIDVSLLSASEIAYINSYHERTYEALAPLLSGNERQWLLQQTKAISCSVAS